MELKIQKELVFFRSVVFTHSENYVNFRRLTEFESKTSIACREFIDEVSENIINLDAQTQIVYLNRIASKLNFIDLKQYIDRSSALDLLRKYKLDWRELDAFYRTLRDFYILEENEDGSIGYFNKEPDIPTDYDVPEMAFLNKGIGFMTVDDLEKYKVYDEKYGAYNKDVWDVHMKDILPEKRFLELVSDILSIVPELKVSFPTSCTGGVEEKLSQLKYYIFNGIQKDKIIEVKTFIENTKSSLMKDITTLKFDNFQIFIKSFEYNYPLEHPIISYIHQWKTNLSYLKKEILDNSILLNQEEKDAYLRRLRFECNESLSHAHTSMDVINSWLKFYETNIEMVLNRSSYSSNLLSKILNSPVPKFEDTFHEDFIKDTEGIQHDFYNYYYGHFLNEAISFIDEQTLDYKAGNGGTPSPKPKLKTDLTVAQLSYFFKLLMEEHIVNYTHKTEVHNFISSSFSTKRQTDISADSVKNNMDTFQIKDIEIIKEKLIHLLQLARKDAENIA